MLTREPGEGEGREGADEWFQGLLLWKACWSDVLAFPFPSLLLPSL